MKQARATTAATSGRGAGKPGERHGRVAAPQPGVPVTPPLPEGHGVGVCPPSRPRVGRGVGGLARGGVSRVGGPHLCEFELFFVVLG